MKKMKKLLTLSLLVVLSFVIVGCGPKSDLPSVSDKDIVSKGSELVILKALKLDVPKDGIEISGEFSIKLPIDLKVLTDEDDSDININIKVTYNSWVYLGDKFEDFKFYADLNISNGIKELIDSLEDKDFTEVAPEDLSSVTAITNLKNIQYFDGKLYITLTKDTVIGDKTVSKFVAPVDAADIKDYYDSLSEYDLTETPELTQETIDASHSLLDQIGNGFTYNIYAKDKAVIAKVAYETTFQTIIDLVVAGSYSEIVTTLTPLKGSTKVNVDLTIAFNNNVFSSIEFNLSSKEGDSAAISFSIIIKAQNKSPKFLTTGEIASYEILS